jgi:hypothetical protein
LISYRHVEGRSEARTFPIMAAKPVPTVAELLKAAEITDQEIEAAVDTYMTDRKAEPFRFASGHEIDPPSSSRTPLIRSC